MFLPADGVLHCYNIQKLKTLSSIFLWTSKPMSHPFICVCYTFIFIHMLLTKVTYRFRQNSIRSWHLKGALWEATAKLRSHHLQEPARAWKLQQNHKHYWSDSHSLYSSTSHNAFKNSKWYNKSKKANLEQQQQQ